MCLIAVNWNPDATAPLTLIGNRDEFYARPTVPLHWWEGAQVLAGRDLRGGGTWLGVTMTGRVAAVTNFRAPAHFEPARTSRGHVVRQFLQGRDSAYEFCLRLQDHAHGYNPFNMILFDGRELLGFESRVGRIVRLPTGVSAVSNADFNSPWPKVQALKASLAQTIGKYESAIASEDELLALLSDTSRAQDHLLPDTGIPVEREGLLSSIFIRSADYGTRASSLVRISGHCLTFIEKRYDAKGELGESSFTFKVARP